MTSEREKQPTPREYGGNPWNELMPWQPKPQRKMSMDWLTLAVLIMVCVAVVGVMWMMR